MKNVTIQIGTHSAEYQMPESWQELTTADFIYWANHPVMENVVPCQLLAHLLHVDAEAQLFVTPIHWDGVHRHFPWIDSYEPVSRWMVPSILLSDGREVLPPSPDFSDVTWEEFMFADELAQRNRWSAVAATLYRPTNPAATEDESPRVPFTDKGTNNRHHLFKELQPDLLNAVGLNYLILRKHMTKRYRHLFSKSGGSGQSTSWLTTSRAILGENVWHDADLRTTPVNTVLFRLDNEIKNSIERQRNERRS